MIHYGVTRYIAELQRFVGSLPQFAPTVETLEAELRQEIDQRVAEGHLIELAEHEVIAGATPARTVGEKMLDSFTHRRQIQALLITGVAYLTLVVVANVIPKPAPLVHDLLAARLSRDTALLAVGQLATISAQILALTAPFGWFRTSTFLRTTAAITLGFTILLGTSMFATAVAGDSMVLAVRHVDFVEGASHSFRYILLLYLEAFAVYLVLELRRLASLLWIKEQAMHQLDPWDGVPRISAT